MTSYTQFFSGTAAVVGAPVEPCQRRAAGDIRHPADPVDYTAAPKVLAIWRMSLRHGRVQSGTGTTIRPAVRRPGLPNGGMEMKKANAVRAELVTVHNWRVSQLTRLGIPAAHAEVYADRLDWHQIAKLVLRGCPPRLALRIVH